MTIGLATGETSTGPIVEPAEAMLPEDEKDPAAVALGDGVD